jgi:hypothetical protein
MINVNIVFEFMSMILKNYMFKVDLTRSLKNANNFCLNFLGCPKNQLK